MKLHGNARLSVKGRELLIDRVEDAGWSLRSAAEAAGISDRTARKWLGRYQAEGSDGDGSLLGAVARREPDRGPARRGDRRTATVADDRR